METCEREMGSESETRMEWEDPVTYWQERSRRALASQGVVVPRRRPPELLPDVIGVRRSFLCIGLDLICNSCGEHIPKSTVLRVLRLFYSPYGSEGSPHTRYFARCPNCVAGLVLGRNIGDVETLVVISGAIDQHFPAKEPNLQNEVSQEPILLNGVSPDDPVDSDSNFRSHVFEVSPESPVDTGDSDTDSEY